MLPLSENYIARVPIATGLISDAYSISKNLIPGKLDWDEADQNLTTLQKLYLMARYLEYNDFFRAQVDQIYVNKEREIEIIPKVGDHLILFGGVNNLEEKFDKLMAFYREGLRTNGWSKYSILNIKYKNQVICSNK
jgi:cell division protein FtsQ